MQRQSGHVFLFAVLVVSVLVFAPQASAQQTNGFLRSAATASAISNGSAFLTAGLAQGSQQPPPPPGGGNSRHEGIGIGAEAGPIFSGFSSEEVEFGNHSGFEGGIFFGGNRPGILGVMGKLLYAKKGAESTAGTQSVNLYYLEIPVLARVNVGSNSLNGILVYGVVGPVFDILLKGSQDNVDVKSNYESLDVGLQFGGGIEITRFLVEGVYTQGFMNVLNVEGSAITDVTSHSFAILFGFRFN